MAHIFLQRHRRTASIISIATVDTRLVVTTTASCARLTRTMANVQSLQEKGEIVYEPNAYFRVDEFAFYVYWKADGRVSKARGMCMYMYVCVCYSAACRFELEYSC